MNSLNRSIVGPWQHRLLTGLCAFFMTGSAALAAPVDGRVVAGSASIATQGATTRIEQSSQRAVINWRGFGTAAHEAVEFHQPGSTSATLNRVTGNQVSVLLGRLDASGQVILINPNGVVIGNGAQINVGSFIATTANMQDHDFMAGRLVFDAPGETDASVINEGLISAAEGGLVALVAPHVRNDGMIRARLGKVVLGAADTFTIDLYGDGLISMAVDEDTAARLLGVSVGEAGTIDVGGGETVLMTAAAAANVIDSVINLSGTVLANDAKQVGGRIVLSGAGADITVSGTLDASGGQQGGTIHVGGEWQGGGATPRAQTTHVSADANINVSATANGNAGEAVIWADDYTLFAGTVLARGGILGGDGGRVEVSGLRELDFRGFVDAGATAGQAGSLLLDPAVLTVYAADAGLISRVLRTGTSTSLSATDTININSAIDGRGNLAGGGLTLLAGNTINVNDFIITNNGALNFTATAGAVNIKAGKALFAGNAAINIIGGGNLTTGPMITTGPLSVRSTGGSVTIGSGIAQTNRDVLIRAALDLLVNQPITNFLNGSSLDLLTDTGDIIINAQVDGRDLVAGGSGPVNIDAGNDILLNSSVLTDGSTLTLSAGGGISASGAFGLFADTAPITVTAVDDIFTMAMITSGLLSVESTAGSIFVDTPINELNGNVSLLAANNLTVNQPLVNFLNGSSLSLVAAGGDLTIGAQVDGRDLGTFPGPSGTLTLSAGGNFLLNENIITDNAPLTVTAGGAFTPSGTFGLFAGNAPITVTAGGNVTTAPMVTSGDLNVRSTSGSLTVAQGINEDNGNVALRSAGDLTVSTGKSIVNFLNGSTLSLTSDTGDVIIDAQLDGRAANAIPSGALSIVAGQSVQLNADVLTEDATLQLTATGGSLTATNGSGLFAGSGDIIVTTAGNLNTGVFATTGNLTMRSTAGSLTVDQGIVETVADVDLRAFTDLHVNSVINNIRTGDNLVLTADTGDINIDDRIDAQDDGAAAPVAGGSVTLSAGKNVNLNETITTFEGAVSVAATTGTLNIATAPAPDYTKRILITDGTGNPGTAALTVSTGGDLTTGAPVPGGLTFPEAPCVAAGTCGLNGQEDYYADQMKVFVALSTAGAISLTSTAGDVTVDAPVPFSIGEVTINAADAVVVNQMLLTDSQPITITAGAGGVTVNGLIGQPGYDGPMGTFSTPVDSRDANLTITAIGDINAAAGVASNADITLTSTAGNILGTIGDSLGSSTRPDNLYLDAFGNIGSAGSSFQAGYAGNIEGLARTGLIRIDVERPDRLRLDAPSPTAGDVFSGGFMGPDVIINAGRDIDLNRFTTGSMTLNAGRDIRLEEFWGTLTATAGNDIIDDFGNPNVASMVVGHTVLTATNGSVLFKNDASILAGSSDVLISAGDSVVLNEVQTIGGLSVTALNGSITLNENVGAELTGLKPGGIDPDNLGLAFLTLQANGTDGAITMVGARSAGLIDIDTSGLLTTAQQIISTSPTINPLTIYAGLGTTGDVDNPGPFSFAGSIYGVTPLASQMEFDCCGLVSPAVPPGPMVAPPAPPPAISALPPSDPSGFTLAGFGDPGTGSVGTTGEPGGVALNSLPAPAAGGGGTTTSNQENVLNATDDFGEIVPDEESEGGESGGLFIAASDAGEGAETLVFEGGSGAAASSDLGQSGSYAVSDGPAGEEEDCTNEEGCEE